MLHDRRPLLAVGTGEGDLCDSAGGTAPSWDRVGLMGCMPAQTRSYEMRASGKALTAVMSG